LSVFVVDADVVVHDGMEADVLEVRDLLHSLRVVAVALAHGEDGAAGAEHLFPEMRERRGGSMRVDGDGLGRLLGEGGCGEGECEDEAS